MQRQDPERAKDPLHGLADQHLHRKRHHQTRYAPFTDISTSGLVGVFVEDEARQIIDVIERINETAVA